MKKILLALLLVLSFAYAKAQVPQAPIIFNTVQQMINARTSYTIAKVNDTLRGGIFNKVAKGGLVIDSGVVMPSIDPNYVWVRDITDAYGINGCWWGAKNDYIPQTQTGTNSTRAIQNAINYAFTDRTKRHRVYLPAGSYLIDSLLIPAGIYFTGENGMSEQLFQQGTKLYQKAGSNNNALICYNPDTSTVGARFWYGVLSDFSLLGSVTDTVGYGIIFRQPNKGTNVALQDMNEIRNLTIRQFKQGGILFPGSGGIPLNVFNVKVLWCGGPAFTIQSNPNTTTGCAANFTNCGADGCVGGMFRFVQLQKYHTVTVINGKTEYRDGNPFSGTYEQPNPFVVVDCDSAVINIVGFNPVSSVDTFDAEGNTVYKKPGDLIKLSGGHSPLITWQGVAFRVRPTDIGTDPVIISGTNISYKTNNGSWPNQYGNNNVYVTGLNSKSQTFFGTARNIVEVNGTRPAYDIVNTSSASGGKIWRTTVDGIYYYLRKINELDSTETDVFQVPRTQSSPINFFQNIRLVNAVPNFEFFDTNNVANIRRWAIRMPQSNGFLKFGTIDDDLTKFISSFELARRDTIPTGMLLNTRLSFAVDTIKVSSGATSIDVERASLIRLNNSTSLNVGFLSNGRVGQLAILIMDGKTKLLNLASSGSNGSLKMACGTDILLDSGTAIMFERGNNWWHEVGGASLQKSFVNTTTLTASGDGTTTTITVTLPASATWVNVQSAAAASDGIVGCSVSGTILSIRYSVAPPSGTNNLSYYIGYK